MMEISLGFRSQALEACLVVKQPEKIPTHIRHCLTLQQPSNKAQAFFHHRTLFPRHPHLPPAKKRKV
jgi:hypothetical protein